jgi:hypothetical protein
VVEWLTHLLPILEVPGLNLGTKTACLTFCGIPEFLQANEWMFLNLGHDLILPHSFLFIIHYHPFIRRYIICIAEKASLNKLQITSTAASITLPTLGCVTFETHHTVSAGETALCE